jgi:site-specific DNA-methyltransferase (adenine-specific)
MSAAVPELATPVLAAPLGPVRERASRNRTLTLTPADEARLRPRLHRLAAPTTDVAQVLNRTFCQPMQEATSRMPDAFVDLLFLDPPYNLTKTFGSSTFRAGSTQSYIEYLESWLPPLLRLLKPTATVYICGDWRSAAAIQLVAEQHLHVRNRITWEREKGRGARTNWKNATEDIWFCTLGTHFYYDAEAVKLRRRVVAPYRQDGQPKDWEATEEGNFRLTHASNCWTDLTVPFWSMPENTDHPTQKPEKLMAKLMLASTPPGGVVLDPFGGSGTTATVAFKLGRQWVSVEREELFCLWAERRLELAAQDPTIQGYAEGVFWDRNSGR